MYSDLWLQYVLLGSLWLFMLLSLPWTIYLGYLTLSSLRAFKRNALGPVRKTVSQQEYFQFIFIIPAHNEASIIKQTIESIKRIDYPARKYKILVVADNCTDNTASCAIAAGAMVLQRKNLTDRGKGYALNYGFQHILEHEDADAVVVIDADTNVDANILHAFSKGLMDHSAMQGNYGVRNPLAGWRTQLLTVAMGAFHRLRSLAREHRLLSCGLRGNGMCFSTSLLRTLPHHASGLVEDVEYGISLGLAGIRVAYIDNACVYGDMVASRTASVSQRLRWESGRKWLQRTAGILLFWQAWRRKDSILLDLALDLFCPPLASVTRNMVFSLLIAVLLQVVFNVELWLVWGILTIEWALLVFYVLRGTLLSQLGWRGLPVLLFAPFYIVWKSSLALFAHKKSQDWVRTQREQSIKSHSSES